jgi:hypothetical protein
VPVALAKLGVTSFITAIQRSHLAAFELQNFCNFEPFWQLPGGQRTLRQPSLTLAA